MALKSLFHIHNLKIDLFILFIYFLFFYFLLLLFFFLVAEALEVKIKHNTVVLFNLTRETRSPFVLKHTTSCSIKS